MSAISYCLFLLHNLYFSIFLFPDISRTRFCRSLASYKRSNPACTVSNVFYPCVNHKLSPSYLLSSSFLLPFCRIFPSNKFHHLYLSHWLFISKFYTVEKINVYFFSCIPLVFFLNVTDILLFFFEYPIILTVYSIIPVFGNYPFFPKCTSCLSLYLFSHSIAPFNDLFRPRLFFVLNCALHSFVSLLIL